MRNVKAADIMNRDLLLARESMTVAELATFLTENEISGAPVVDDDGHLTGVVSLSDVARVASQIGGVSPDRSGPDFYLRGWEDAYATEDLQRLRVEAAAVQVSEIMTRAVHSVPAGASLQEVAAAMVKAHVHRLLVVGEDGKEPLGLVSTMDVLRAVGGA